MFRNYGSSSKGLFIEANHGTLFLDELTSLPLSLQPKLLRALEEREVLAVGSTKATPFDARLISAANQTLEKLIEKGEFRDDLDIRQTATMLLSVLEGASLVAWALKDSTRIEPTFAQAIASLVEATGD